MITLFDIQVGDLAECVGSDVGVGLRLDLAGAADDGGQVLTDGFAGGDLGDVGLSVSSGSTGALGKSVREDLGGIEYNAQALALACGQLPSPERAEIAVQLLRTAQLREQLLGEVL